MKDILKHYSKYILLDTLVVATLFAGAHAILSLFHLKFIEWVYYAVIGIITVGHISIIVKNTKELCEICSNMCWSHLSHTFDLYLHFNICFYL